MAIAIAGKQIMVDGIQVTVGTGHEQISLVQNAHNQLASEAYDAGASDWGWAAIMLETQPPTELAGCAF